MLIGYAKVFTHDQYLDLQKDDINAAGFERIFVDDLSGSNSSRLGLQQAIESLGQETCSWCGGRTALAGHSGKSGAKPDGA